MAVNGIGQTGSEYRTVPSGREDAEWSGVSSRGAESWWGCSDSGSDSDSGFGANYEINSTLIVERVYAIQAKKKRDISN